MPELYTTSDKMFETSTAELIYYFIPKHLVFKEFGLNLYPPYEIEKEKFKTSEGYQCLEITLTEKSDFIDLFEDTAMNLKIICGKNGCGKTTLLELMAGHRLLNTRDEMHECVEIYKDCSGRLASTVNTKVTRIKNGTVQPLQESLDSKVFIPYKSTLSCVTHKKMDIEDFAFEYNVVEHYKNNKELYDNFKVVDGDLFTHFNIRVKSSSTAENLWDLSRRYIYHIATDKFDFKQMFDNNLLLLFLVETLEDNTYDGLFQQCVEDLYEDGDDSERRMSIIQYFDEMLSNSNPALYDKIIEQQKTLLSKSYSISQTDEAHKEIDDLYKKVYTLIQTVLTGEADGNSFIPYSLPELLYFDGYAKTKNGSRTLRDLSTGEYWSLKVRYEMFHSMMQQRDGLWWYYDEPDCFFHPEWSRQFLNNYITSYKATNNYLKKLYSRKRKISEERIRRGKFTEEPDDYNENKRWTVIFATHSPLFLSDVTNDYVVYLEKAEHNDNVKGYEKGYTYERKAEKQSFAGNIGEMYSSNFFMENTIGEFARQKITKIIQRLNEMEKTGEGISEIDGFKRIVSKIGDDLLRNLLEDKIRSVENSLREMQ